MENATIKYLEYLDERIRLASSDNSKEAYQLSKDAFLQCFKIEIEIVTEQPTTIYTCQIVTDSTTVYIPRDMLDKGINSFISAVPMTSSLKVRIDSEQNHFHFIGLNKGHFKVKHISGKKAQKHDSIVLGTYNYHLKVIDIEEI